MNEKRIVNIISRIGLLILVAFLMIIGLSLTVLASSGDSGSSTNSTSSNSTSSSTNSTASSTDTRPTFNVTNLFETPQFWICIGFGGIIIGILIAILAYRMLKLKEFPEISVTHDTSYKRKKLGRLVQHERSSELFPYWRFYFKKTLDTIEMRKINAKQDEIDENSEISLRKRLKAYTIIYGKDSLPEMMGSRWVEWNLGIKRLIFLPHYHLDTISLPPALWFKEKVIKDTPQNKAIYMLFRIFFKAKFIHKYLEYEDSEYYVKEIQIFQHEHKKERTYYVFYTTFEERTFYKEQGIAAWIRYPEREIVSLIMNKKEIYRDQIENAKNNKTPSEISKDLIEKHDFIQNKLNEQKMILNDKVQRGYLKEEELSYYKTIFEIEDMNRMKSQYRKVKRHGDPIAIQKEVRNLVESIKNPQEIRELLSHEELKNLALLKDLKESQKREQEQRDRNNELALNIEKRAEELLEGWERDRDERVKEKFEHSIHALKLKRKYGFDDQKVLVEATKLQVENEALKKDAEIKQLKEENKKLKNLSSDLLEKKDEMTISLASPEKRTIRSKQELEEILKNNGGN